MKFIDKLKNEITEIEILRIANAIKNEKTPISTIIKLKILKFILSLYKLFNRVHVHESTSELKLFT